MLMPIGKMGRLRPRLEWRLDGGNTGVNGDIRNPLEFLAQVFPATFLCAVAHVCWQPAHCREAPVTPVPVLPGGSWPGTTHLWEASRAM